MGQMKDFIQHKDIKTNAESVEEMRILFKWMIHFYIQTFPHDEHAAIGNRDSRIAIQPFGD
jgi:hypothetical protein